MSHVVPRMVQGFKGQDPLHILGEEVRFVTTPNGGDLARGIVTGNAASDARNEDFTSPRPRARPFSS